MAWGLADGYGGVKEYVGRYPDGFWSLWFFVIVVGLHIALWRHADAIDDRSFNAFCAPEEPPDLFRDPAWIARMVLCSVGLTPAFSVPLVGVWVDLLPALPRAAAWGLGFLLGGALAVLLTVWRVHDLAYVWSVQKTLRRSSDRVPPLWRRVVNTLVYLFGVLVLALLAGDVPAFLPTLEGLAMVFKPILMVLGVIVAVGMLVGFLRHLRGRHRFLRRLRRLRDRGELSLTVHGHPYLSLISRRVYFGLTVTDEPSPESGGKTPATYRVAIADCNYRRPAVVLWENHVYRFRISIGRFVWYRDHSFDFPEGEGRRILIIDPTPTRLLLQGAGSAVLDNGDRAFDYTVYGRNAFVNHLERT